MAEIKCMKGGWLKVNVKKKCEYNSWASKNNGNIIAVSWLEEELPLNGLQISPQERPSFLQCTSG